MSRTLISGGDSNGTVAIFELIVPCGGSLPVPAHSHDHYEETIYGVQGVWSWTVDGTQIDVGPGETLCIRRGAIHRFDNKSSENVKTLCVITPAAFRTELFSRVRESNQQADRWPLGPGPAYEYYASPWPDTRLAGTAQHFAG